MATAPKATASRTAARRSGPARSRLWLLLAIVLAIGVAAAAMAWWRSHAARQDEIATLLADIDTETGKADPDSSALSQLVARVRQLPGHETERALQVGLAKIAWVRSRLDEALALVLPFAAGLDARTDELTLAARVQLQRHALGSLGQDPADTVLRQALAFAEQSHARTPDAGVLLLAWVAAFRLGDAAEVDRLGAMLGSGDGPPARLVRAAAEFTLQSPLAPLDDLRRDFPDAPLELELMRAQILLAQGEVGPAMAIVEPLLHRGAALVLVRHVAAIGWHAQAMAAEEPARTAALRQRDAHLGWLLANARGDDGRRPTWQQLLEQR